MDPKLEKYIQKMDNILNRPWNAGKKNKLIEQWQESVIKERHKLIDKAKKSKADALSGILMFNAMYILEDENGEPYTKERLQKMTHEDLKKLLEFYVEQLEFEVGEIPT